MLVYDKSVQCPSIVGEVSALLLPGFLHNERLLGQLLWATFPLWRIIRNDNQLLDLDVPEV